MPKVLNVRVRPTEPYIFCGRPSPYGNHFIIGKHGTRTEVIQKYKDWIMNSEQSIFRAFVKQELKGKNLGCYCAPLACHCDILLEIANS